ncbi:MAG: hypothetical protein KC649_05940 [Candidatus Omnitrophica bacterium]|nr:hypothetical protein [Candidatus Omnitrophota bacterium]
MKPAAEKNKMIAMVFSLVPGAAQIYLGRPKKGVGLLFIFAGICWVWIFSDSYLARLISIFLYGSVTIVPMIETYQILRYGKNTLDSDAAWYVVFLLISNGFAALPMLWQSRRFSRASKTAWTVAVPVLAFLYIAFLIRYWPDLERFLRAAVGRDG